MSGVSAYFCANLLFFSASSYGKKVFTIKEMIIRHLSITPLKLPGLLICVVGLCVQCRTKNIEDLHGTWKVDSVYSFYNGFDMTTPGQEPLYHFQPDGRLRMTQNTEFRYFTYKVQDDSLTYSTLEDKRIDGLLIVALNDKHLVLKKTKSLLFKGDHQQRFEIKYFSKVED